jgi:hypothetical protein
VVPNRHTLDSNHDMPAHRSTRHQQEPTWDGIEGTNLDYREYHERGAMAGLEKTSVSWSRSLKIAVGDLINVATRYGLDVTYPDNNRWTIKVRKTHTPQKTVYQAYWRNHQGQWQRSLRQQFSGNHALHQRELQRVTIDDWSKFDDTDPDYSWWADIPEENWPE